jgi:tetratricopeptide (TPR) repeat protein
VTKHDPTRTNTTTNTSVDLGDDLLAERTRILSGAEAGAPESRAAKKISPDEKVRNAEILMREGFSEDAKRLLHGVIDEDAGHLGARKLLERLHDVELKQIFSSSSGYDGEGDDAARSARELGEIEAVIRRLDDDLELHLAEGPPGLSLFRDVKFTVDSADLRDLSAADKMDLGVAFLEMGLLDQAVPHLQSACRTLMSEQSAPGPLIEATALLAYALIVGGRAMEATQTLEPMLRDTEIDHASKLDLLYLMGRAYEELKMGEPARQWYRQARQLDARYRDVEERLRKEIRS